MKVLLDDCYGWTCENTNTKGHRYANMQTLTPPNLQREARGSGYIYRVSSVLSYYAYWSYAPYEDKEEHQ